MDMGLTFDTDQLANDFVYWNANRNLVPIAIQFQMNRRIYNRAGEFDFHFQSLKSGLINWRLNESVSRIGFLSISSDLAYLFSN